MRDQGILWGGVDVGGARKGFHAAMIDDEQVLAVARLQTPGAVTRWLLEQAPALVAVDSPRAPAPSGETSRLGERQLVRARVCNIRWTPDRSGLDKNPEYYVWITHGFELYAALELAGLEAIECFPTASWTRWAGRRGDRRRSEWSQRALEATGLRLPAARLTQDDRDAVGAALTARAHSLGETESFGDIVVPLPPTVEAARVASAVGGHDVAREVIAAAEQRSAALVRRDATELRRLLHPKLRWTTHDGVVLDRTAYIDANASGDLIWRTQQLDDVSVVVEGDVAVLLAVVTDEVERDGAAATHRLRLSQTWVRDGGSWRCIAGHASAAGGIPAAGEPRP